VRVDARFLAARRSPPLASLGSKLFQRWDNRCHSCRMAGETSAGWADAPPALRRAALRGLAARCVTEFRVRAGRAAFRREDWGERFLLREGVEEAMRITDRNRGERSHNPQLAAVGETPADFRKIFRFGFSNDFRRDACAGPVK
jgi:hypothetical protein